MKDAPMIYYIDGFQDAIILIYGDIDRRSNVENHLGKIQ